MAAKRRRLAQADANQVTASTAVPKASRRSGIATVANRTQAGTVPSGGHGALAAGDGVLARLGQDQSPTRGEAAALAALNAELGG